MKRIKLILLILTISSCWVSLAQSITQEEKNRIIADLDSVHSFKCSDAIDRVIDFRLVEALPKVEANFWKVRLRTKPLFLYALREFNSPRAYEFAKAYLDSLKTYQGIDTTDFYLDKSYAITILFDNNDFSYSNYILSLLCCKDSQYKRALSLLYYIINFDMVNSQRAMDLLINAIQNADSPDVRSSALFYYNFIKGKEALPLLINSFLNDKDARVRGRLLNPFFFKEYISPEIETAIRTKIKQEDDARNRREASFILLRNYHNPINYKIISELEKVETDPFTKRFLKGDIDYYIVRRPSKTLEIKFLIDSLLSYTNQIYDFSWIRDEGYKNQLLSKIQEAQNFLNSSDSLNCYKQIKSFQTSIQQVYSDSAGSHPKYVSKDAYKFLYYYPKYILERLPSPPTVKLEDSQGNLLPGGSLQYYENGWKNADDNDDGTFTVDTKLKNVSMRMTYAYGSQTKNNVAVSSDTVVFQTVNAQVKLNDSSGSPLDTAKVQYYANGWRDFGTTENGMASKELLAANYTFRITYGYASIDKQQNLSSNPVVSFSTVNTKVFLRDSQNNLIDEGTVQYYSNGWRKFGNTVNGVAQKELLPVNYTFRMSYGYASVDKQQNISVNSNVDFNTVLARIRLLDSGGNTLEPFITQYYSNGWREFGTSVDGIATKELLPINYSFRMNYGFASNDKQQNISQNNVVEFRSINTQVKLMNTAGSPLDIGTVQYYANGWRAFGLTDNGIAVKELLPSNYTFRMSYEFINADKTQNNGENNIIEFVAVPCTINVKNNLNQPINGAVVSYYANGWRTIGTATNGTIIKDLLPSNTTFRARIGTKQTDKTQNTALNNIIDIIIE